MAAATWAVTVKMGRAGFEGSLGGGADHVVEVGVRKERNRKNKIKTDSFLRYCLNGVESWCHLLRLDNAGEELVWGGWESRVLSQVGNQWLRRYASRQAPGQKSSLRDKSSWGSIL